MIDIYTLENGTTYIVKKMFTDFRGNEFLPGEMLTYIERNFAPYHGGHTIIFKERNIYLQEDANQNIIDNFADYLSQSEV